MKYNEIKKLAKEHNISDIDLEIVSCVNSSSGKLSDEDFDLICEYVKCVWQKVDSTYIQLISDIMCDLYEDLDYGYREYGGNEELILTKEDLKYCSKIYEVRDIYYDRFC